LELLIDSLVEFIKQNPVVILGSYPESQYRLNRLTLDNLLNPWNENHLSSHRVALRRKYFDSLADIAIDHCKKSLDSSV
jgi:hypothetical protein